MVRFNELRITEDRKCLIVDVEIEQVGLYSGMHIEEIYLDYYKNVDSSGFPSNKSYKMYPQTETNNQLKGVRVSMFDTALEDTELGVDTFKDGLFYVTVVCDGDIGDVSKLPCGTDDTVHTQAVIDWRGFYERGMQYISSMFGCGADKCELPAGFEDFILLWNALKAAISTCDWPMVSKLWDRILRSGKISSAKSIGGTPCGCGR